MIHTRHALFVLATLAFAPLASAQLTVPTGPLATGSTVDLAVNDPSRANQTVTIEIAPNQGETTKVELRLDANGHGKAQCVVPDCLYLRFNYFSQQVERWVL